MGDEGAFDKRLEFVGEWFTNSLKVKEDKWKKIVNDEEAVSVHMAGASGILLPFPLPSNPWLCVLSSVFPPPFARLQISPVRRHREPTGPV